MDKYINSTKVLNFIQDCLNHEDKISDTEKATLIAIRRYIERTQIEDVAPVIHGKWHDVYMTSPSSFAATCSICGISNDIPHPISAHYCPHCGAKMDGESNV